MQVIIGLIKRELNSLAVDSYFCVKNSDSDMKTSQWRPMTTMIGSLEVDIYEHYSMQSTLPCMLMENLFSSGVPHIHILLQ